MIAARDGAAGPAPGGPESGPQAAPGASGRLLDLAGLRAAVEEAELDPRMGRVVRSLGLLLEARGCRGFVGELCEILPARSAVRPRAAGSPDLAEVVAFRDDRLLLMPFAGVAGLSPGDLVRPTGRSLQVAASTALRGRVLDPLGRPMDGEPLPADAQLAATHRDPPDALTRPRIQRSMHLGIRALDGLLTVGEGQRLGLFAGSGIGKSTLLGMMARRARADVNVIALVGERSREVREFLDQGLGAQGRARSVVVVAPSSASPILRVKAGLVATTLAEWFRDHGAHVLFLMDSLSRYAAALREIGLAVDEPPTARGYPPSVFTALPHLLERAGTARTGSITGFYTVLVEGDDPADPVADAVRGYLDGHIMLSRELAGRGHHPAIDVTASVSRVMPAVTSPEHQATASSVRRLMAESTDVLESIQLGSYRAGDDPDRDRLLATRRRIDAFLRQDVDEPGTPPEALAAELAGIAGEAPGEGAPPARSLVRFPAVASRGDAASPPAGELP